MIEGDIKKHTLESYPNECVGYIFEKCYHRLKNISKTPKINYRLSLDDKFLLSSHSCQDITLVHSHTVMDNTPSHKDLMAQQATAFHFIIVGTDGKNTTNLRRIRYEKSNNKKNYISRKV